MANSQDLDAQFRDFGNGAWGLFVINDLQGEQDDGADSEPVFEEAYVNASESALCAICNTGCAQKLSSTEAEEVEARIGKEAPFLCADHYAKYVTMYPIHHSRVCCDPLHIHKKRCTVNLVLNTLEMFKINNVFIPGKKTCRKCRQKIIDNVGGEGQGGEGDRPDEEGAGGGGGEGHRPDGEGVRGGGGEEDRGGLEALDDDSEGLLTPDGASQNTEGSQHDWSQDYGFENVNSTLQLFGESPLKKKTEGHVNEKLSRLNQKMRATLGVSTPERNEDAEGFLNALKERYQAGDFSEKYRCLTSCPASFTAYKLSQVFGCGIKMAHNALKLREEHGAGSCPAKRVGRRLPEETKELVVEFYMDQNMSRHLPGKNDTVSVRLPDGRKEPRQKHMLLCNLNEAFCAFKMKYPDTVISFSSFAELRPKQVVLAGDPGTHSVCVC